MASQALCQLYRHTFVPNTQLRFDLAVCPCTFDRRRVDTGCFYRATLCASAVYAVVVCLSSCSSQAGIVSAGVASMEQMMQLLPIPGMRRTTSANRANPMRFLKG